MRMWI